MELKDFNIFNLSLEQKKLLKKKIGQGGGSGSDESIAIFTVEEDYVNEQLVLTLKSGTPKLDGGKLQCKFEDKVYSERIVFGDIYDDGYFTIENVSIADNGQITTDYYTAYNANIDDFLNASVGDTISFNLNDMLNYSSAPTFVIDINSQKAINSHSRWDESVFSRGIVTFRYAKTSNITEQGFVKRFDTENNFMFIEINDEVWKYSFTKQGRTYSNFTFVEVVQS